MAIELVRRPWSGSDPFAELSQEVLPLRTMMDRLMESAFAPSFWATGFDAARGGWSGGFGMDVYESNDAYTVSCLLPGVNPEQVSVTMQDNVLTISGESRRTVPEGFQPVLQEIGYGRFERRLTLGAPVETERAEATYHDGVLTITLPKAEWARPRSIKVHSNGYAGNGQRVEHIEHPQQGKATIQEAKAT